MAECAAEVLVICKTGSLLPEALPTNGNVSDPGGPCGPVAPFGPAGPVGPCGPTAPLVMSNTPCTVDPLFTVNRNEPAGSAVGKSATICVLEYDTKLNVVPSSFTTGAPDDGVRLVPVMAICLVAELTMALTIVGV
jgi:hypothetical protein